MGFPGGSVVKDPPVNAGATEMQVGSLGREDPLQQEMATHLSILACRIPVGRGASRATVCGVAESDMTEQAVQTNSSCSLSVH